MNAGKDSMYSRRIFSIGNRFLVPYLAFLSAFAPLSTDMYLPALPTMARTFDTSNEVITLTTSSFLFIFAFSMLFWGPLSDRYGRRPVLLAGSAIFVVSSAAIALSSSLASLLIWRGVQAVGSGAAGAMSLAVVKDILRGSLMEKVVGWMQAATILAPLAAPVIGGWMLLFVSWRGIFWCLAICGALAFAGCLALKETGANRSGSSLLSTFGRMGVVLRKRRFLKPLLLFSAMAMPFMSYLAVSSFIFQDSGSGFGLSAQSYSGFFALNASVCLLGPFAHMYVFSRLGGNGSIIVLELLAMSLAGAALTLFGGLGPWFFALMYLPVSFCGSAMRPPSTVIMMRAVHGDNGLVASLINCGGLFFGSLSMLLASLPFWGNPVLAVGCIACVVSAVCLFAWLCIRKDY